MGGGEDTTRYWKEKIWEGVEYRTTQTTAHDDFVF
jgi:hypothetical protein